MSTRAHSAGFSLVEVLIALVVLGVGLMGLARLQLFLLAGTVDTASYDHAIRLANDRLESLRFTHMSGLAPASGADQRQVQSYVFSREWTVNCAPNQLCAATVSVRWDEPSASSGSQQRETTVDAYLAPSDLKAQAWLVQAGPPKAERLP